MVIYLSKLIALFLLKKEIFEQKEYNKIRYGLEIIFSAVINILIVLIPAVILHKKVISICFVLLFILIRKYSGGYHADTHLKCNILFGILYFFVIIFTKVYERDFLYRFHDLLLLMLVSSLVIIYVAPIENTNKKIDIDDKLKFKKIVLLLIIISDLLGIICYNILPSITSIVSITLFEIMFLCLLGKIKERRLNNE